MTFSLGRSYRFFRTAIIFGQVKDSTICESIYSPISSRCCWLLCATSVHYKSTLRVCAMSVRYECALQCALRVCATSVHYKCALRVCATRVRYECALRVCATSVHCKCALRVCATVCATSVPISQESESRITKFLAFAQSIFFC